MLDREACERRVYRLATLLTGNPLAATRVIAEVVDVQPDLRHLDSAHLDRLTVLRSRDIKPATIVADAVPMKAAQALSSLTAQQREAWVFARVYGMDVRELSKAMDCSVTATQRHLDQADAAMAPVSGDRAETAAHALRAYSMTLDVPAFYRIRRLRRRRIQRALVALGIAIAAILLASAFLWWARPLSGT